MKKILIAAVAIIAVLFGFQFYVASKVDSALQKTELNKLSQEKVLSWLEKLKELGKDDKNFNNIFANIDENFIKENIQIRNSQNDKGLFGSNAVIELSAGPVLFEIKAQISYLLGNFKAKGQIMPKDDGIAMIIQKAFKDNAPFTFTYDDKLTLNMAALNFNDGETNFASEPLWLSAGQKDDLLKLGFGAKSVNITEGKSNFTLKNAELGMDYKGLNSGIKNMSSKTFLNVNEANVMDKNVELSANNFKFKENSNVKENILSSNLELNANKFNFVLLGIKMALSDIMIKTSFANLNIADIQKDPTNTFSKDSKIDLSELSFKIDEQKIALKLAINLDSKYDKAKFNEIENFISLKGSFSSQKQLSAIFPQFATFIAPFEQDFLKNGYLEKNNEGYKTSFEGSLNKLLFNKDKELNVANFFAR